MSDYRQIRCALMQYIDDFYSDMVPAMVSLSEKELVKIFDSKAKKILPEIIREISDEVKARKHKIKRKVSTLDEYITRRK